MPSSLAPTAAPPRTTPAPATRAEQRSLLAAGTVLLLGLFADGWAHSNMFEELEGFVTSYHTVIFVGFLLSGAVVLRMVMVRRPDASSYWTAAPAGYRIAFGSLLAFGVGFLSDGVWHTIFGLEADIDALLSPSHLLMAGALLGLLSAPVRAFDRTTDATGIDGATGRVPAIVVTAIAMCSLVVAFFLMYLWVPVQGHGGTGLDDFLRSGAGESAAAAVEISQQAMVAGSLVVTGVMVATLLAVLRRGRPPAGALGAVAVLVPTAISAIFEFREPVLLVPFLLSAALVEALVQRADRTGRASLSTITAGWAAVTWTTYWLLFPVVASPLAWEVEIYPGQVVVATALAWWLARTATATTPERAEHPPAAWVGGARP